MQSFGQMENTLGTKFGRASGNRQCHEWIKGITVQITA